MILTSARRRARHGRPCREGARWEEGPGNRLNQERGSQERGSTCGQMPFGGSEWSAQARSVRIPLACPSVGKSQSGEDKKRNL